MVEIFRGTQVNLQSNRHASHAYNETAHRSQVVSMVYSEIWSCFEKLLSRHMWEAENIQFRIKNDHVEADVQQVTKLHFSLTV